MVRGRRARTVADTAATAASALQRLQNGNTAVHLVDDQYCASPKRKDCRIDDVATNLKAAIQTINGYHQQHNHHQTRKCKSPKTSATNTGGGSVATKEISNYQIFEPKTRSQTAIRQYFRETKTTTTPTPTSTQQNGYMNGNDDVDADDHEVEEEEEEDDGAEFYANGNSIGAELEVQTTTATNSSSFDITEDTCDGMTMTQCHQSPSSKNTCHMLDTSGNIFLQAPVLSLNVDKSPNQASSIKINKTLEVDPIFPTLNGYQQLNGQFNKIVSLRSASLESTTPILLNTDSNSCDSGVVVDKHTTMITTAAELSPSRRRKPTTPHRILCPSPVKHAIVEKASPNGALSKRTNGHHGYVAAVNGHANGMQKRNPKSRRRLNTNQSENLSSVTSPQLVGGVTLTNALTNEYANNNNNACSRKQLLLNSPKNSTADGNSEYTYKTTQNKIRGNGQLQHQPRERNLQNHNSSNRMTTIVAHQQAPVDNNKKVTDFFPVRRSVRKTKKAVQEEMMRSIEKAIIEGREEGLRVEHFENKGRGIIAERDFKRGEFVVEYIGELITIAEANERETKYSLDENAGCYMYYFKHRNQQYCIDATAESGKLGRLVNHSRNGNLITKVVVIKNQPHLVLIAKDDIQAGEEFTYDYGDRSKESLAHHPWLAL